MCKLFLFVHCFPISLHIYTCIRVMNWLNVWRKTTHKILKEHSQNESENIQVFYLLFFVLLFSVFFLKLNQTLIVGYQVTKVEWLTILCSVLVSFFLGGGGVRGLPNYLTEDYKFLTKPLIDKNIVQLCSTETKK